MLELYIDIQGMSSAFRRSVLFVMNAVHCDLGMRLRMLGRMPYRDHAERDDILRNTEDTANARRPLLGRIAAEPYRTEPYSLGSDKNVLGRRRAVLNKKVLMRTGIIPEVRAYDNGKSGVFQHAPILPDGGKLRKAPAVTHDDKFPRPGIPGAGGAEPC